MSSSGTPRRFMTFMFMMYHMYQTTVNGPRHQNQAGISYNPGMLKPGDKVVVQ
jgi:hypothetical protein